MMYDLRSKNKTRRIDRFQFNVYAILFICFMLMRTVLFAQGESEVTSGKYKRYTETRNKFSFLIPVEWKIIQDEETDDKAYLIRDLSKENTEELKEIFTIKVWGNRESDTAFFKSHHLGEFFTGKVPGDWHKEKSVTVNGDRVVTYYQPSNNYRGDAPLINGVPVLISYGDTSELRQVYNSDTLYFIKGKNWKGYYSDASDFGGESESLFFFGRKDQNVIQIESPYPLEEKVRKKIVESFKFD